MSGATTVWQLPYPSQTDPADVPSDVKKLCDRLEILLSQVKAGGAIPGEMRLWPGTSLPPQATYGHWVWADGTAYDTAVYPLASGNIATAWKTFGGLADPGTGKFRVPDMRGVTPTGPDAMPGGARANRITRANATTVAGLTGTEYVTLTAATMPSHGHGTNTSTESADHTHSGTTNAENAAHTHSGNTGYDSNDHSHTVYTAHGGGNTSTPGGGVGTPDTYGLTVTSSGVNAYHYHSVTTGTESANHAHGFATGGRSTAHTHAIANEGGGGAHENMAPTAFVPYIVKLDD